VNQLLVRHNSVSGKRTAQGELLLQIKPGQPEFRLSGLNCWKVNRQSMNPCWPAKVCQLKKGVMNKLLALPLIKMAFYGFALTHLGEEAALARIVPVVEQQQGSKRPSSVWRYSFKEHFWSPGGVVSCPITFLLWWLWFYPRRYWRALETMVAVLVIACPVLLFSDTNFHHAGFRPCRWGRYSL